MPERRLAETPGSGAPEPETGARWSGIDIALHATTGDLDVQEEYEDD
jgi:hypothetical protein